MRALKLFQRVQSGDDRATSSLRQLLRQMGMASWQSLIRTASQKNAADAVGLVRFALALGADDMAATLKALHPDHVKMAPKGHD